MRPIAAALLLVLSAGPALADGTGITLTNAWSRASAGPASTGAAYVTVTAAAADELTGASTPVAATAEVHRSEMKDGVMMMRPATPLAVSPGVPVQMKPGGFHVMLMGLKAPLVAGTHFPLTLVFAKAGPVTTDVTVGTAGSSEPPHTAHH